MHKNPKLGELIKETTQRDAIHVAVAPVVAGIAMRPGAHVIVTDGKAWPAKLSKSVGVIDPFLRDVVDEGQTFWLMLHPGSITSLRHEWTHPAFKEEKAEMLVMPSNAEIWLRAYAMRLSPYKTPEDAFNSLMYGLRDKEIFADGSDLHGLYELDDASALRAYAQEYLGVSISWEDYTFSCSC